MNFSRRNDTEPAPPVTGAQIDLGLIEKFHRIDSFVVYLVLNFGPKAARAIQDRPSDRNLIGSGRVDGRGKDMKCVTYNIQYGIGLGRPL